MARNYKYINGVTLEFSGGSEIKDCITVAKEKATELNVPVIFEFNSVTISISPNCGLDNYHIADLYYEKLNMKKEVIV